MSNTIDHHHQTSADSIQTQQDASDGEYQTLRGCLVLSALVVLCAIIFVVCVLLFGVSNQ